MNFLSELPWNLSGVLASSPIEWGQYRSLPSLAVNGKRAWWMEKLTQTPTTRHAWPPVVTMTPHDRNDSPHFMEKQTEAGEADLHRSPKFLFFPLHPATSLPLSLRPAWGLVWFCFYSKFPSETGQDWNKALRIDQVPRCGLFSPILRTVRGGIQVQP